MTTFLPKGRCTRKRMNSEMKNIKNTKIIKINQKCLETISPIAKKLSQRLNI